MKTRGFITIATGDIKYSKLAYNLLMSYRRFTKENYPFSVITDKKNIYLEQFDNVILLKESKESFLDKLLLFKICPYDETIFIDADSLAFGNLCMLFNYFDTADYVSCIGKIFSKDSLNGWFRFEDVIDYQNIVEYTVWLHGGIYFIRKDPKLVDFYNTCITIADHYKKYFFRFKYLVEPADEPIVALAMAIHKIKPIHGSPEMMAFYRDSQIKKIDIISGTLSYSTNLGKTDSGLLIHWATSNTERALYRFEIVKLMWSNKQKNNLLYLLEGIFIKSKLLYFFFLMKDQLNEFRK